MNNYSATQYWKVILISSLMLIVVATILYSNFLADKLATEERKKVELIANVYKKLNNASDNLDISFMFEIISSNATVPLILADETGKVLGYKNLDSALAVNDKSYLPAELVKMKKAKEPIPIVFSANSRNYIYYDDSYLLKQLIYFPYIQSSIILVFIVIAYFALSSARRAEQNRVWVGMAKETAHQLGTPLSSLTAWVDYLENSLPQPYKDNIVPELSKDVQRLETITNRFSKIGSQPTLNEENLLTVIETMVDYIRQRASGKVEFTVHQPEGTNITATISVPLFDWVLENLLKNALDAMDGSGRIDIYINQQGDHPYIDVKDTGKGIPSSKFKTVFAPGFSTKQRGWGLGLSLSKRIIENYHNGKIFVKESVLGKGTTFRIILNKK
ncbi:MAG TPA: hypothetical protein DCQ93_00060 [Bacteroidetes bacterium]|mgnify:CR=1 FL=1|nr:hypothetical protein [Bacteroidota bacterium]